MLKIYDSIQKEKREFKPIKEGHISIYVCGNTVYDYCHIGHARSMTVFDTITRYLRSRGHQVTYIRNITDIDDKIIKRAQENNEPWDALTERFIKAQGEDEVSLNILSPDQEPRATHHIAEIIALIQQILERKHGYVADNGDVYFDVRSLESYGQLSNRNVDELQSGARIQVGDAKRDALDFVLWKKAKLGEPSWDSPWGEGRPGWHIECSAMSTTALGQPFDIHGGGLDLKFPHHENEIAQSEAVCDEKFANYWMHVGLLQISGEKMSKSLGNFLTIRDALDKYHPETIRYFMVSSHYRSPVNAAEKHFAQIHQSLERLYRSLDGLALSDVSGSEEFEQRFNDAMDDDFNTPEALAVLFDMSHLINKLREEDKLTEASGVATALKKLGSILGILQLDPAKFIKGDASDVDTAKVDALIAERQEARANKDWDKADQIRAQLTEMQIIVDDTKGSSSWRKA